MGRLFKCWSHARLYVAVIWLQTGIAGMTIIAKFALNQGLNHYTFVVYRHTIATIVVAPFALIFERMKRPKMTIKVFAMILLLGFLEPVADQNLYYAGLNYTTATFVTALCNVIPAFTFMLAWIFRLEKVNLMSVRSQAKVVGTVVTIAGAMVMTLVNGPILQLPWTEGCHKSHSPVANNTLPEQIKGATMIFAGCICLSLFINLQTITLKSYPAELSLTALICAAGAAQGLILALVVERGDLSIWAIGFDIKLLAIVYGGLVCSGIGFYIQGWVMKERGPVFVSVFSPLGMVIVAVMSSFILSEQLFLGSVIGAVVIVGGLYLVVWGKSKDYQKATNDEVVTLPVASAPAEMVMGPLTQPET